MKISMLTLLVVFSQSCETEIPPEDPTPPEFLFRLTGDGFDYTFDQDFDFDNMKLNLKRGADYNFIFSGGDAGGVSSIRWSILPVRNIRIDSEILPPWTSTSANGNQYIRWNGDSSNPLTGSILGGRLHSSYDRSQLVFRFVVTDFGGETGSPNTITKELSVSTGNVTHRILPIIFR